MTYERYMQLNHLADQVVAKGHDRTLQRFLVDKIRQLPARERRIVIEMVFECKGCGKWRNRADEDLNSGRCFGCAGQLA